MTGNYYYGACDGFHFSDNYVTGDNIYLRELQNFFFEVLGMMSITHYGAIGDGRTDNYGPIQVAIDDANRRGLAYIYVPYGRFIYTGELINMENITFVGNPKAKIVNIRTGEEITILQFGIRTNDNYYSKTELDALLESKQDNLIAGDGIRIDYNIISATGGGSSDTMFTTCPFPTTWSGTSMEKTGTNEYGTWTISVPYAPSAENGIELAFDGDTSTKTILNKTREAPKREIQIDLPDGVQIRPAHIYLKFSPKRYPEQYTVYFQGYNPETAEWENLYSVLGRRGYIETAEVNDNVTTNNFYTKFRIYNLDAFATASIVSPTVTEFQVTAGLIRVSNSENQGSSDNPLGGE